MNKKFFAAFFAVLCAAACVFALGACTHRDGDRGASTARYLAYDVDEKKYDEEYYLDINGTGFKMTFGEESEVRSVSGEAKKIGTELTLLVTKEGVETVFMKGRIGGGIIYIPSSYGRIWFCERGKTPADANFDAIIKCDSSKGKATVTSVDNGTVKILDIPSVHDGDTVTTIGTAFTKCEGLERINLPATITEIKEYAFGGFDGDVVFDAESQIKTIGDSAFYNFSGGTLKLPASVETIADDAFDSCSAEVLDLTALKLTNCPKIKYCKAGKIMLPVTVKNIPENAFYGSSAEIDFGANTVLTEIGSGVFEYYDGATVILPSALKTIGENAFAYSGIESITIPASVTKIKAGAFRGCYDLKSVTFKNTKGWRKVDTYGFDDPVSVTVTNPSANASALVDDAYGVEWVRS